MAESILRRMMEEGIYTKEELCAAVGRACKKLSLDQVLGVFQEVRQKQTPQSETQTPSKAFRGRLVRISEPVQLPQTTEEEYAAVPETEHYHTNRQQYIAVRWQEREEAQGGKDREEEKGQE